MALRRWDGQQKFDLAASPPDVKLSGDKLARGRDLFAIVDVTPPQEGSLMVSLYFERRSPVDHRT
eukprot:1182008-Prorocentrum_minimum.AAC.3